MVDSIAPRSEAQEDLLSLLYQLPVAVAQLDESGAIRMLNAMGANLLMQIDPQPVDLDNLFTTLACAAPGLPALVASFAPGHGTICENLRVTLPTEGPRPFPLVVALTLTRVAPGSLLAVLTDISQSEHQRERLERQRRDREEELDLAQRVAHLGYFSLDLAMRAVTWSDEVYRMLGLAPGAFKPRLGDLLSYVHSDDRPLVQQLLQSGLRGSLEAMDIRLCLGNGSERRVRLQVAPLPQAAEQKDRVLYALLDVTDQKMLERELLQAKEQAESAARAQHQFLNNMSHELRTPLNGVLGHAELLLQQDLGSMRSHVDLIRSSGEALLARLDDVIELARIEAGRLPLSPVPFLPSALGREALELVRAAADARGLALKLTVDPRLPPLRGDLLRLRQVLGHLLDNAVRFTERGGVSLLLHGEEIGAEWVLLRVSVADTGIGIAGEQLARVFEPFSQADESSTRVHGGAGLGLSLCRRLLGLMGGALGVESEPGHGSVFWFSLRLPVAPELPAVRGGDEIVTLGPGRVLVVEDNLVNQKVATRMLERLGLDVDLAGNGAEALERVAAGRYDAVLMDCQMPEMDGYEATRRIRERLPKNPPIIALTAHAMPEERQRCLESGMDDFLSKPVRIAQLCRVLQRHLRRAAAT